MINFDVVDRECGVVQCAEFASLGALAIRFGVSVVSRFRGLIWDSCLHICVYALRFDVLWISDFKF